MERRLAILEEPTVRSVERALDLLECLAGVPSLGLGELSVRTALSKSTVHRLLAVLERRGLVARDAGSQRYAIGPGVVRLAGVALGPARLRELARPLMCQLRDRFGETVTITVRIGDRRMFVDQVESLHELRRTIEIGTLFPLTYGSGGKAILAFADPADRDRLVTTMGREALTQNTPTDPTLLRAELEQVRARSYAVSFGERVPGVTSVAAPVFDARGRAIAVLSVTGPSFRILPEDLPRIGAAAIEAAGALSELVACQSSHEG